MGLEGIVKSSMLFVSCTASVEAVQTDIQASRIILKIILAGLCECRSSRGRQAFSKLMGERQAYDGVKALSAVLSIHRLVNTRRSQL